MEQVIDNLKNNKSCGPGGITGQLIKENKRFLLDPFQ